MKFLNSRANIDYQVFHFVSNNTTGIMMSKVIYIYTGVRKSSILKSLRGLLRVL